MTTDLELLAVFLGVVSPPAMVSVAWWVRARLPRRPASRREMHCRGCGYDCSAVWPTPVCPECGGPPDPGEPPPPAFLACGAPLAVLAGPLTAAAFAGVVMIVEHQLLPGIPAMGMLRRFLLFVLLAHAFWLGPLAMASGRMRPRERGIVWASLLGGYVGGAATGLARSWWLISRDALNNGRPVQWAEVAPTAVAWGLPIASIASVIALLIVRWHRRRESAARHRSGS